MTPTQQALAMINTGRLQADKTVRNPQTLVDTFDGGIWNTSYRKDHPAPQMGWRPPQEVVPDVLLRPAPLSFGQREMLALSHLETLS